MGQAFRVQQRGLDRNRARPKPQVACKIIQAADIVHLQEADYTASVRCGPPSVYLVDPDDLLIDFVLSRSCQNLTSAPSPRR